MSQLEDLAQHRDAILLAEIIGWLHDYRKCSESQLQTQSANTTAQGISRNELINRFSSLLSVSITLSSTTEQFPDLINQWSGQWNNTNTSFLRQYLSRCHNTSHFDKQDPNNNCKQNYPGTQISTAFGFETAVGANLTNGLWALPWNTLTAYIVNNRRDLLADIQALFATVGADTRRPINEVSLWDWGLLVGALYKSAIAATVIGHQSTTYDLRWRLLSVRTDGLAYLTSVSRLPDLIARQKILRTALDNVQILLEETYPLATEVYRDENGSLYVVPDIPNLLTDLQDSGNQTLFAHILQQFDTDGDVVPDVRLDTGAWWGQDPDRHGRDEIPPAGNILSMSIALQSDANTISQEWQSQHNEICVICGLRPRVGKQVNYCQICGQRRRGRMKQWIQDQSNTIWLDEVADSHGRLAMVTGTFDLTNWNNGKLVETLLVKAVGSDIVTKTPSFARLRRVWRTTQIFWQETQSNINHTLADSRRRLKITLADSTGLTTYQTYELDLHGQTRMSVLWDGAHLISIDNLSYTAVQLNIPAPRRQSPSDAALEVGLWLDACKDNEQGQRRVFQLFSDDERNNQFRVQITHIDYQDTAYSTAIPILAEPRTFMALVPADKALEVAQAIKAKYEREMGKVRNRLPLHLGLVYAHRRTPLRTILDAGQRMLRQKPPGGDQPWRVKETTRGALPGAKQYLAQGTQQFQQTITVYLEQGERSFTWYVPAVMGDGQTDDNWYPYVFFQADKAGNTDPTQATEKRLRVFKGVRPTANGQTEACRLVHAGELKAGDQVYFTPATLDFEWLDTAARRFAIAYDEQSGRRRGRLTRPYLLDDLSTLTAAWECIGGQEGLPSSQIYALRDLVEARRAAWFDQPAQSLTSEPFRQLCRDAVVNAEWKQTPSNEQKDQVVSWLVSGLFADMVELFMSIMKAKPERNEETL